MESMTLIEMFLAIYHRWFGLQELASAVVSPDQLTLGVPQRWNLYLSRMTVPPNTVASFSIWGTVWLSSRVNRRAHFIIGAALVAILGTSST